MKLSRLPRCAIAVALAALSGSWGAAASGFDDTAVFALAASAPSFVSCRHSLRLHAPTLLGCLLRIEKQTAAYALVAISEDHPDHVLTIERVFVDRRTGQVRAQDPGTDSSFSDSRVVDVNLAAAATPSVDSNFPGYGVAGLVDGLAGDARPNYLTSWASAETSRAHWVELRLPAPFPVRAVIVHWAWDNGHVFSSRETQVQTYERGRWRDLGLLSRPDPTGTASLALPGRAVTRLRLYQPQGRGSTARPNLMWIAELEVKAAASATPVASADALAEVTRGKDRSPDDQRVSQVLGRTFVYNGGGSYTAVSRLGGVYTATIILRTSADPRSWPSCTVVVPITSPKLGGIITIQGVAGLSDMSPEKPMYRVAYAPDRCAIERRW